MRNRIVYFVFKVCKQALIHKSLDISISFKTINEQVLWNFISHPSNQRIEWNSLTTSLLGLLREAYLHLAHNENWKILFNTIINNWMMFNHILKTNSIGKKCKIYLILIKFEQNSSKYNEYLSQNFFIYNFFFLMKQMIIW